MNITRTQIERLYTEAGEAGDMTTVAICRLALDGDITEETFANVPDEDCDRVSAMTRATARAECERVIADAGAAE